VTAASDATSFEVSSGNVVLRGTSEGDGPPIVMLHGLTATRRYVVHGSRALPRAGFWTVAYDARGHGESDPAEDRSAYEYSDLAGDLCAVLDGLEVGRAVVVGVSMGAHTALRLALEDGDRVAGLVLVTPAFVEAARGEPGAWEELADALERDGVDGFLSVWGGDDVSERWREAALENARQRLERHRDLRAVADALRVVPGSAPFDGLEALRDVDAPALVVGSRDEADPTHPLSVAERYADALPRGELLVEDEGKSPLAWQGARLSREIGAFLDGRG
jgi:3-oxoadipate enol-lactonase